MNILVAEDDKDTTEMYRIVLEARGHAVVKTHDGRHCLEAYKNAGPFDVVVLDYKLPVIDGLEVAKEILETSINQRIVFVSAYAKNTLADSVKNLKRVVELISKPFEPELLADLLEDELSQSRLRELNINNNEIIVRRDELNDADIEKLLQQLKSIQKPDTISTY